MDKSDKSLIEHPILKEAFEYSHEIAKAGVKSWLDLTQYSELTADHQRGLSALSAKLTIDVATMIDKSIPKGQTQPDPEKLATAMAEAFMFTVLLGARLQRKGLI